MIHHLMIIAMSFVLLYIGHLALDQVVALGAYMIIVAVVVFVVFTARLVYHIHGGKLCEYWTEDELKESQQKGERNRLPKWFL